VNVENKQSSMTIGESATPRKSPQTVTAKGERMEAQIDGVRIRAAITHQDERGSLSEIYSDEWRYDEYAMVHSYMVTVRPGRTKGWALHREQVDRYFFALGSCKLVLYDDRAESPTRALVMVRYFSHINRSLVTVPPGVYHAVENVGQTDVVLISIPDKTYCYADPDKYTLPLDNDLIPYRFDNTRGY
jgi:dTDP-4-dehydrorhamnose 3,5-epimerase